MTSLSSAAFGRQPQAYGYAPQALPRTASQPHVNGWASGFGASGGSSGGYPYGVDPGGQAGSHGYRPQGLTYPILSLPVGTRKKKVLQKIVRPDGTEEEVLVDGEEEEEVYERRKRLFYFDR